MFRRFFFGLIFAIVAAGLTACGPAGKPGTETADAVLYAVKSAYAVAQKTALSYARLPRCEADIIRPCSKPAVVNELVRLDNEATAALKLADLTAATFAVLDFSAAANRVYMEDRP